MAKETIKVVQIDTNPASTSIKDLRNQLKGFKDEMANLEEGSDAFLEVANKAGEVKHQIDEINESIKGASADFGDMVGNITNVAAGITGSFQAVAGGLQAMGVESEAIDEAIVKMQGLMAVTQGLSAIGDGIKSFAKLGKAVETAGTTGAKGMGKLKKALIGTGIGALVVVVGSLIANWEEFSKAVGISETQLQKFGDVMKGVLNSALSMIGGVGKAISRLVTGDFKGAGEAIKEGFAVQANFQKGVEKAEEERTKKQKEEAAKRIAIEKEEAQKKYNEFIAKENEKLDIELERIKRKDLSESDNLKETLAVEKERLKLMKEGTLEYEQQLTAIHNLETALKELEKPEEPATPEEPKESKLSKEEQDLRDYLSQVSAMYLAIEETDAQYFKRREEELKAALDKQLISEEEYTNASKVLARERAEYQKVQNAVLIKNISDTVNATSNFITGILDTVADQQDQSNREGFEKAKKLQIASATIQMFTGIATALSGAFTTKTGVWDLILAGIQAASIAASGIMNINKIKNTKFDGGGSASANVSSGAVNSMVIPPVQYTQAVQAASTEGAIKDTKVYVTETDISNTITKVNVQETENTY
jgi:uncharacterized protein YqgQ